MQTSLQSASYPEIEYCTPADRCNEAIRDKRAHNIGDNGCRTSRSATPEKSDRHCYYSSEKVTMIWQKECISRKYGRSQSGSTHHLQVQQTKLTTANLERSAGSSYFALDVTGGLGIISSIYSGSVAVCTNYRSACPVMMAVHHQKSLCASHSQCRKQVNVNVNVYRSPPVAREAPWPEPRSSQSGQVFADQSSQEYKQGLYIEATPGTSMQKSPTTSRKTPLFLGKLRHTLYVITT